MVLSKKTTTIQDVARRAGVSAATVSRVLSAPQRVSEPARQRVYDAVRDTGYTINQAARSLRMRSARTILIALPDIGNAFYSTILDAVVQAATERGYSVLVASHLGPDPTRWLDHYLRSNRADGLIVFDGSLDTKALHAISPDGATLPIVAAYDEMPDPHVNSVITDNRAAARRAVEYLVELGHTRIGHISGIARNSSPNERLLGFHEAMTAAGLDIRPEWIFPGEYNMTSGEAAAERLAALKDRPTAVFAANDEMAIGVISRGRELGIECPRDLSVIGFDDIEMARYFYPPLTTMAQPRDDIGRIATNAVIDIVEGGANGTDPLHVVLTSPLVARASTARARG